MINGGMITVAGGGGGGSAAAGSGIMSINGETGPTITNQSSDNTINITVPSTNIIDYSCSGFVSGVQQQIEAKLAVSGQTFLSAINASGQVLLSVNSASGQYLWTQLNVSGQYILSSVVRSIGVQGGADLNGDVDLLSTSGFIIIGDNAGSSPVSFDVDIHALSGFWGLGSLGAGNVASVGVLGGADLTGDIDFSDPSGFIVWGDTAGANPITASIDTHALSGLWDLNLINLNRQAIHSSGQVLLSENSASGQYLWTQLKVSGQQILSSVVRSIGVQGGANLSGDVDLVSSSGFVVLGDNTGTSPISFDVDIHSLSGFWGLGSLGAGNVTSVGALGGADLTGDIDFSDPSGFIVWGDTVGASPVTASVDIHALSGFWGLSQIDLNKQAVIASGQVLLSNTADHNSLDGLQGGTGGQYYHLTEDEHNNTVPRKYYGYFNNFGSGYFNHGLNTKLLTWGVYASGTTVDAIEPDQFRVMDEDHIFLKFNSEETGLVVIMG